MAQDRGNEKKRGRRPLEAGRDEEADTARRLGALPELVRRTLSLGLSGFFLTEEAIRRAVGDTIPKDWMDFAVDQSERARREFLERLSYEIGQSIEKIDVAAVLRELLEGRTLEIRAEIRLGDKGDRGEEGAGVVRPSVNFSLRRRGEGA
jgi:hypothetical protein